MRVTSRPDLEAKHSQDARIRRNKHGNRNVDPYETMWKELANGGRFYCADFRRGTVCETWKGDFN